MASPVALEADAEIASVALVATCAATSSAGGLDRRILFIFATRLVYFSSGGYTTSRLSDQAFSDPDHLLVAGELLFRGPVEPVEGLVGKRA